VPRFTTLPQKALCEERILFERKEAHLQTRVLAPRTWSRLFAATIARRAEGLLATTQSRLWPPVINKNEMTINRRAGDDSMRQYYERPLYIYMSC
jgi:hypothetical protein